MPFYAYRTKGVKGKMLSIIVVLMIFIAGVHGGNFTVTLTAMSPTTLLEGMTVTFLVTLTPIPSRALPCSEFMVWPFMNSTQWGANVPLISSSTNNTLCEAQMLLPIPNQGATNVFVAFLNSPYFATYFIVGEALPLDTWNASSNVIELLVLPNPHIMRKVSPINRPLVVMYWEPWFTPHNANWLMSEAIPLVGRYSSLDIVGNSSKSTANRNVVKQHCMWFSMMHVGAIGIDWTNNIWGLQQWEDRGVYAQEIMNATYFTLEVYAQLHELGYQVPQFVLLLGLDNGAQSVVSVLNDEILWVTNHMLQNPRITPLFITLEDKPLLTIFDGGDIHSQLKPVNGSGYTIRWMSSQFQADHLNQKGFYSWMDGTITPPPTYSPINVSTVEAMTITNAFFTTVGGWLDPSAVATNNGATLLEEGWQAANFTPQLLFVCQWNEYNGQPSPSPSYVDIYNATLGNDMEPTSLSACGLVERQDDAFCGGWGFRYANILSGIFHLLSTPQAPSLLLTIKHPVPWMPHSRNKDLTMEFVTMGNCPTLAYFLLTISTLGAVRVAPTERQYIIPAAELRTLPISWRGLDLQAIQSDGKICVASVQLLYDDMSIASGLTTDTVMFRLVD